ncbi:phage terminase large subunit family protein [Mesorhizobium argentiipisi]|uniref:Phage terminase large subunit family protein n=1 Tax=Mesorhizobium argentiipisi TaxID=3015175 RepID=A0ABU8KD44_9HYPH
MRRRKSLSRWIEGNVVLPREVCADPGPMRLWPWHRGIVEAVEDPAIERITLVKPVRVGFSTLLHAVTAYHIAEAPAPILSVLPTDADCRRVMVSELERIFEASPNLEGKLPSPKLGDRTGQHRSTILHRLFDGGSLHFVAARAPRNLRGPTARILLCDEVDGMVLTDEGSPIDLAIDRTHSFGDRKIIIGSTPGDEETSLILPLYAQSDRRVFEVPCPDCGAFTEILWQHIQWEPDKPHTATFCCPSCGVLVDEKHKPAMVRKGRWRATGEANGHAGFRLNALVSLLANASWGKLAADFLLKKDDSERLKTFVTRFLGQGWRDEAETIDENALAARAEGFSLDRIPAEVVVITIGVDVQDDRLECSICGWSREGECLILGHMVIWGSPDDNETWQELEKLLRTRWKHPHGGELQVDAACVDSGDGDWTDCVYRFCFPRAGRRVMAIKGAPGSRPSIAFSKSKTKGGRLWIVGVDTVKTIIVSRLARAKGIRFSAELEPTYFEQLASERRVVRFIRGRPIHRFERIPGAQAEALDCLTYAFAARAAVQIPLDQREDDLRAPPAARVPPPVVVQSRWMTERR